MDFPALLQNRLDQLEKNFCRRFLSFRKGLDFSSNDYLGLSQDPNLAKLVYRELQKVPLGSSASRLLRGQLEVFEETEKVLASFTGSEAAILFSSGFQANLGLLTALLTSADWVFSDENNHASIIDGIRLSGAKKKIYPHLNISVLRELLESHKGETQLKVIVTESLFGMDGDIAPLKELADLAEEFSALLVVDEAHATGLWGNFETERGGGIVQSLNLNSRVFATIHPAGKAMGVGGAWISGSTQLKDYLSNFSRPFIFSTAPLPALAVFLRLSVCYWKKVGPTRVQAVFELSHYLQTCLRDVTKDSAGQVACEDQIEIPQVQGPIIPVIIGSNERTMKISRSLQAQGFDVRAIRPPTVPEGKARLRLATHWSQSKSQIEELAYAFKKTLEEEKNEKRHFYFGN